MIFGMIYLAGMHMEERKIEDKMCIDQTCKRLVPKMIKATYTPLAPLPLDCEV